MALVLTLRLEGLRSGPNSSKLRLSLSSIEATALTYAGVRSSEAALGLEEAHRDCQGSAADWPWGARQPAPPEGSGSHWQGQSGSAAAGTQQCTLDTDLALSWQGQLSATRQARSSGRAPAATSPGLPHLLPGQLYAQQVQGVSPQVDPGAAASCQLPYGSHLQVRQQQRHVQQHQGGAGQGWLLSRVGAGGGKQPQQTGEAAQGGCQVRVAEGSQGHHTTQVSQPRGQPHCPADVIKAGSYRPAGHSLLPCCRPAHQAGQQGRGIGQHQAAEGELGGRWPQPDAGGGGHQVHEQGLGPVRVAAEDCVHWQCLRAEQARGRNRTLSCVGNRTGRVAFYSLLQAGGPRPSRLCHHKVCHAHAVSAPTFQPYVPIMCLESAEGRSVTLPWLELETSQHLPSQELEAAAACHLFHSPTLEWLNLLPLDWALFAKPSYKGRPQTRPHAQETRHKAEVGTTARQVAGWMGGCNAAHGGPNGACWSCAGGAEGHLKLPFTGREHPGLACVAPPSLSPPRARLSYRARAGPPGSFRDMVANKQDVGAAATLTASGPFCGSWAEYITVGCCNTSVTCECGLYPGLAKKGQAPGHGVLAYMMTCMLAAVASHGQPPSHLHSHQCRLAHLILPTGPTPKAHGAGNKVGSAAVGDSAETRASGVMLTHGRGKAVAAPHLQGAAG
ncbi:hypothetical protein HaLaN_02023 [Haematococcus lacustris]|uniref:Uncharacterized protein n=1 Tax=Haematococcus lacustris TaxID=44745 RepID=A0A699YJT4_HAELA|nr:hypothetical protein HaLaN_02023 [Haematococcus lacustris]